MQIPDALIKTGIALEDRYFDLKGLSVYSAMGVTSLRYHIKANGLPCYSVRGEGGQVSKILVKRSEFDQWMVRWKAEMDIQQIADDIISRLKTDMQSKGHMQQSGSSKGYKRIERRMGADKAQKRTKLNAS